MQRRTLLKAFALSASVISMGFSLQVYAADTIKVGIMHSMKIRRKLAAVCGKGASAAYAG